MSQPGWYPDPSAEAPGRLRWWDGGAWGSWTKYPDQPVAAPARPAAGVWPAAPDPLRDLDAEQRGGRNAVIALLAGLAFWAGYLLVLAACAHPAVRAFQDWLHLLTELPPGAQPPPLRLPDRVVMLQPLLSLASLGPLVVQIVFAIWLYQASRFAQRAGLALRRSPGLAVAGLFIPIVNFWWPYQAVSGLFPPGYRGRPRIGLWWLAHLCLFLPVFLTLAAGFVSTPLAVAVALLGLLIPVAEALLARTVIVACGRAHGELAARLAGSAPRSAG